MGSIAAYLNTSSAPDPRVVERMFDAAPHRGPRRIIQVHGRCAIGVSFSDEAIDASIATRDGVTAVVCGRIDNLAELAPPADGAPDRSPAEAVLTAFRGAGDHAPNALRGVFAGILTDGSWLKAFRDHVGFEPLFYRNEGTEIYMASEAKQIVAGAGIPREPDRTVVDGMLFDNYTDETFCALRGVRGAPQDS